MSLAEFNKRSIVLLVCGFTHAAFAIVPEYSILDLNTFGGSQSEAWTINNAGQVGGWAHTGTGVQRGFVTAPNSAINPATDMVPLLSGGSANKVFGVNASGVAAGWCLTSNGYRAYRYTSPGAASLGTLGGDNSFGQAINSFGQVIGSAQLPGHGQNFPSHGVLYNPSAATKDLGTLGSDSFAYSINTNGTVVGYYNSGTDHAFIWSPTTPNSNTGTMSTFNNDLGGGYSYAYGINDSVQIVGQASTTDDDFFHAFLRNPGGPMVDLLTLGGSSSNAQGINNLGMVVGYSTTPASGSHAFLYADGAMRDLNNLIPAGSGWTLTRAQAINDKAQIVGWGTGPGVNSHAFLLTPMPTWGVDSSGSWSAASNWLGSVPNGTGSEVRLTGAITAPRTVTLDSPRTVGRIVFDNASAYTIGGTATLTVSGASPATGIEVRSGAHTISSPVNFASAATISLANSSGLRFNGALSGAITSLQLGSGATLDLNAGNLTIDYDGASPLTAIRDALASGYASGQWNGTGITSAAAAAVAADGSNPHKTALGFAEASALGTPGATALLIRYTLTGDANLDGAVNGMDFNSLASNFGPGGKLWLQGDFNYDGNIDSLDFDALAGNFNFSISAPAISFSSLVPEPGLILFPSIALLFSRRASGCNRRS